MFIQQTTMKPGLYDDFFARKAKEQEEIRQNYKYAQEQQRLEDERDKKKREQRMREQRQLEHEYAQRQLYRQQQEEILGLYAATVESQFMSLAYGDNDHGALQEMFLQITGQRPQPRRTADIKTYDAVMRGLKNVPTDQLERKINTYRLDDATKMQILADILLERSDDAVPEAKKTKEEQKKIDNQVDKIKSALADVTCDGTECTICLDKIENDAKGTLCGHVFHESCIVSWASVKPTCPICKANLS